MNLDAFNHRAVLSRPGESSRLWSAREPHAPGNNWKPQMQTTGRADNHSSQIQQLTQRVAQLERQRQGTSGMHPFKIYQFPSNLRKFKNDDDWRRFKVRSGRIARGPYFPYSSAVALGSDWADYQDGNVFSDEYMRGQDVPGDNRDILAASWNEVAVPVDGSEYYFWYSLSLSNSSSGLTDGIMFGQTLAGATDMYTGETIDCLSGADNFPGDNPYRKMIGSVRIYDADQSFQYFKANQPIVKQWVNTDISFPQVGSDGGRPMFLRFRGLYDPTWYYFAGDAVTYETVDGAGHKALFLFVMWPVDPLSTYDPIYGPITGVQPDSHTPDPWFHLSYSLTSLTYLSGAYDASKYYGRTP